MAPSNWLRRRLRGIRPRECSACRRRQGLDRWARSYCEAIDKRLSPRGLIDARSQGAAPDSQTGRVRLHRRTADAGTLRESHRRRQGEQSPIEYRMGVAKRERPSRLQDRSQSWADRQRRKESESKVDRRAGQGDQGIAWYRRRQSYRSSLRGVTVSDSVYSSGKTLDVSDASEWPADLRIREFPQ